MCSRLESSLRRQRGGRYLRQRARPVDVKVDYVSRETPDAFVVGYGLDAGEWYRNLPYVARLP